MNGSSERLNHTACRGSFAKIQFGARAQQIATGKKFPAQTTTRPRPATALEQISRNQKLHQTSKKLLVSKRQLKTEA